MKSPTTNFDNKLDFLNMFEIHIDPIEETREKARVTKLYAFKY